MDELISRQAAIDAFDIAVRIIDTDDVIKTLSAIPSAQSEPAVIEYDSPPTIEEFLTKAKAGLYALKMAYKYNFEDKYTFSVEILIINPDDSIEWLNDWNEGQTDCRVISCLDIVKAFERSDKL